MTTTQRDPEVAAFLRAMRERLAGHWCQQDFAQDVTGVRCSSLSEKADRWCLYGGSRWVGFNVFGDEQHPARRRAMIALYGVADIDPDDEDRTIVGWQDTPGRTEAEVLAAIDKAIEIAEGACES